MKAQFVTNPYRCSVGMGKFNILGFGGDSSFLWPLPAAKRAGARARALITILFVVYGVF